MGEGRHALYRFSWLEVSVMHSICICDHLGRPWYVLMSRSGARLGDTGISFKWSQNVRPGCSHWWVSSSFWQVGLGAAKRRSQEGKHRLAKSHCRWRSQSVWAAPDFERSHLAKLLAGAVLQHECWSLSWAGVNQGRGRHGKGGWWNKWPSGEQGATHLAALTGKSKCQSVRLSSRWHDLTGSVEFPPCCYCVLHGGGYKPTWTWLLQKSRRLPFLTLSQSRKGNSSIQTKPIYCS